MRIEYEDSDIIVVYKEAGLAVQTGRTSGRDLVSLLKNHIVQNGGEPYLGIVHRLDQPVEGLLVFAKTPAAAASLSTQAASKKPLSLTPDKGFRKAGAGYGMEKIYEALVVPESSSYPLLIEGMKKNITLTDWLGRDRSNNTAFISSEEDKDAKLAELEFQTLQIKDSRALLRIRLHTGRHHQIRIQLAHAGMPIAGDRKYGGTGAEDVRADAGSVLCLCAAVLSFFHPSKHDIMKFSLEPSWLPLISKNANISQSYFL